MKVLLTFVLLLTLGGCQQMGSTLGTGGLGANKEATTASPTDTTSDDEEPVSGPAAGQDSLPDAAEEIGSTPNHPAVAQASPDIIEPKTDQTSVETPAYHGPGTQQAPSPPIPGQANPIAQVSPIAIEPKTDQITVVTLSSQAARMRIGPDYKTLIDPESDPYGISIKKGDPLDLGLFIEASKLLGENQFGRKWRPAPQGAQVRAVFSSGREGESKKRYADAIVGPVMDDGNNLSFPALNTGPGVLSFYYLENFDCGAASGTFSCVMKKTGDFHAGEPVPLPMEESLNGLEGHPSVLFIGSIRLQYPRQIGPILKKRVIPNAFRSLP